MYFRSATTRWLGEETTSYENIQQFVLPYQNVAKTFLWHANNLNVL